MSSKIRELVEGLNEDLAYELSAIHQYIYNGAAVTGLARLQLKNLFLKEAQEELGHAQYLADKIVHLGGEPLTQAKTISPRRDLRKMLEVTKQAEIDAIERYTTRIAQAEALNLLELKLQLENMIVEETRHKEEIERLLEDPRI